MSWLFDNFWFEPGSRMTGIWLWPRRGTHDTRDDVVLFSLIRLGAGQDGALESDFTSSHLPWAFGGIHGVGPDGSPWLLVAQVAPQPAADLVRSSNSWWPLVDSMDRALHFNAEASVSADHGLTLEQVLDIYYAQRIPPLFVDDWSTTELVSGLLAECTGIPLDAIVTGRVTGCSVGDVPHDCQGDTFVDAFAAWTQGLIVGVDDAGLDGDFAPDEGDDDLGVLMDRVNDDDRPRGEVAPPAIRYRSWPRSKVRRWSKKRLRRQAVLDGMQPAVARIAGRKTLTRFLVHKHRVSARRLLRAT